MYHDSHGLVSLGNDSYDYIKDHWGKKLKWSFQLSIRPLVGFLAIQSSISQASRPPLGGQITTGVHMVYSFPRQQFVSLLLLLNGNSSYLVPKATSSGDVLEFWPLPSPSMPTWFSHQVKQISMFIYLVYDILPRLARWLTGKHEDLSLQPSTHIKDGCDAMCLLSHCWKVGYKGKWILGLKGQSV